MSFELIHYDTACRELALATQVDEVKTIRDKAAAMQLYAKLAKNQELLDNAFKIKERAEIRLGELLEEMRERGERRKSGAKPTNFNGSNQRPLAPTLADLGLTKSQSSRFMRKADAANGREPPRVVRAKARAQRKRRDRQIGQANLKSQFLYDCGMSIKVAKYAGPIDKEVLAACRRARDVWTKLTAKLERDHG